MLRSPNIPRAEPIRVCSVDRRRTTTSRAGSTIQLPRCWRGPLQRACVASQRVRVTLCVHASRCVPFSNSRAMSGAPQNTPIRAGTTTSAVPMSSSSWSSLVSWMPTPGQSGLFCACGVGPGEDGVKVIDVPSGRGEQNQHRDQKADGNHSLGLELAPTEPDHLTLPSCDGCGCDWHSPARRMYANTRSSRPTCSTVQAGSRIGPLVRTSSVVWRSVWLASMTSWSEGS